MTRLALLFSLLCIGNFILTSAEPHGLWHLFGMLVSYACAVVACTHFEERL
jgi:hypothetical protein